MVYLVAIAFGVISIMAVFTTKRVEETSRSSRTAARLENEKHDAKSLDKHGYA